MILVSYPSRACVHKPLLWECNPNWNIYTVGLYSILKKETSDTNIEDIMLCKINHSQKGK